MPKFISTKNVAVEKDYYSFTDKRGNKNALIEDMFAELESDVAPVFKKIINRKFNLEKKERGDLISFIALLVTRIKYFRDLVESRKDIYEKVLQKILSGSKTQWDETLNGYNKLMDKNVRMSHEDAVKELSSAENLKLDIPRQDHINLTLNIADLLVERFSKLKWSYLYVKGNKKFILSDNPVTASLPDQPEVTNFGLGPPGINIFLPISPKVCLAGREAGTAAVYDLPAKKVDYINSLVISGAHKFVFASFRANMIQERFKISKAQQSENK